jgi:hypothetical protein
VTEEFCEAQGMKSALMLRKIQEDPLRLIFYVNFMEGDRSSAKNALGERL